jgi:signal transduction histidine kinase/CheY-like chemotaxis protein/HPt (histidine-containing phosphotransfer) domain-containing protein
MLMNEGVEAAATGKPTSALIRRDSFNENDRIFEEHDMVETYLPLRDETGQVIGVFEIHSDISEFFASVDQTQRVVSIGVGAALLSLYLLLMLTFWRSDRRLFMGLSLPGRYRSDSEAEAVSEAKAEFVATISHEVRTPLNAVLGMTDLLNLTSLTRKQREYIQTIQSSGDMLISLVDNLLDFAHLESGRIEVQHNEFDVIDLLERVLRMMGHSSSSKGLELVVDVRHDFDLRIVADKQRLRQILVNVINNAIKFTDEGEVVVTSDVVEAEEGSSKLCFTVADTGPGIDADQRDRLFAAFASGARPQSTQTYGSGLGLVICKKLLDAMGGTIDLRPGETGGTVVRIELPVTRARASSADDLNTPSEAWPEKVLSLHANRSAARSFCRLLHKWDIACETVYDIEDAMHRLRVAASAGKPFDCVIVDSSLTPADRLQTARRIRASAAMADTPIVLLTSISEPLSVGEVSTLGGIRCINKPVLPLELRYNLLRSVRSEAAAAPLPAAPKGSDTEPRELRILIAEDNPVSSGVLQNMLRTEGFGADVVDNGPAVLEELEVRPYDLLLLDCQMPGMDGDVVSRMIRKSPERFPGNPVIVAVTADTTENHRAKCLAAGMDDFVPKPVRLDTLRNGLRRWLAMLNERHAEDDEAARVDLRRSIAERAGQDDESFLRDYIALFLHDTESRLSEMSQAFVSGDTETVRRQGHALKGSCLELGADRMARFCEDLSVAAKHDNLDEVGAVIGRLDREFARLRPFYESAQVSSTKPN